MIQSWRQITVRGLQRKLDNVDSTKKEYSLKKFENEKMHAVWKAFQSTWSPGAFRPPWQVLTEAEGSRKDTMLFSLASVLLCSVCVCNEDSTLRHHTPIEGANRRVFLSEHAPCQSLCDTRKCANLYNPGGAEKNTFFSI